MTSKLIFFLSALITIFCASSASATNSFHVFTSEKSARDYVVTAYQKAGLEAIELVASPDKSRIEVALGDLMNVIRKQNPTKSFPSKNPVVILFKENRPNASVLSSNEHGKTPYIILATTGVLGLEQNALSGLLAHELTHLLLQWELENNGFHPLEFYHYSDDTRPMTLKNAYLNQLPTEDLLEISRTHEVRFFSREDHADVMAVSILKELGLEIHSFNQFLISNFSAHTICNTSLEPPYGDLRNSHPDGCWRAWRNNKFYNSYKTDLY